MLFNAEEKRSFCISKIIEHLNTLDTWEKFKIFVNGISPEKIKAKLKEAYQNALVEGDLVIGSAQDKKIADEDMIIELEDIF